MLKLIQKIVAVTAIISALIMPVALPVAVFAQTPTPPVTAEINQKLCNGGSLDVNNTASCDATTTGDRVNTLVANVINIFSFVVGVVSVIMTIVGGFKYITSGGESSNITGAKNTILYAIIGLVIVALAQVIVKFVISRATPTAV